MINDRNREIRCDATNGVPQLRGDPAAANTRKGNGGEVRVVPVDAECSERHVDLNQLVALLHKSC